MYELIYVNDSSEYAELQKEIKLEFGDVIRFEDASDDIHEHRFAVIGKVARPYFYRFAMRRGFALCCLGFNLFALDNTERVKKWVSKLEGK